MKLEDGFVSRGQVGRQMGFIVSHYGLICCGIVTVYFIQQVEKAKIVAPVP